jgi:hypothetical protein
MRIKRNISKIKERIRGGETIFLYLNMDAAYSCETFVPSSEALHSTAVLLNAPPPPPRNSTPA